MDRKKKHIMAVGAHIGDAELTCGKTLAVHSLLGDAVTTVAVTAGERGAPPGRDTAEFAAYNKKCAEEFIGALGGNFICLGYPDGEAPDNEELRRRLCDVIRAEKPDVILTHWQNSLHKDHSVTSRAVEDAVFYAALRDFERESPPHWAEGPYYAENWEDSHGFVPYIFIDVSAGYDLWFEHIQKLWLTNNSPWFKYRDYYDALSRSRGVLIHKERAECFAVSPYSMKLVKDSF
ncbi:MAG: PIG-L family deacetylase [Treponema sp.]|jgi:LmbE family N-acetylglucosaminyl deacetylase|nr:PIG-L family deacetylase [Treponema sp.]